MLRTTLITVIGSAVVAGAGVVHGQWTHRWQASAAVGRMVADLGRVPRVVGDWDGEAVDVDVRAFEQAGATGHLARRYTNRVTGQAVTLMLICGRSGPISVHTPDACYGGDGFEPAAPPVRHALGGQAGAGGAEFWTGVFRRPDSAGDPHAGTPAGLRLFWAWRTEDGSWTAAGSPRWEFAGAPALYKMYVIRDMASPDERLEGDPVPDFLRQLLPALGGESPARS